VPEPGGQEEEQQLPPLLPLPLPGLQQPSQTARSKSGQ
jgi:hypothetical protein